MQYLLNVANITVESTSIWNIFISPLYPLLYNETSSVSLSMWALERLQNVVAGKSSNSKV